MTSAAILAELEELDRFLTATAQRASLGEHVCMAAQPDTVNGSPEVLVDDGVEAGAHITGAWGDSIVAALAGAESEYAIRSAIQKAGAAIDLEPLAREAEGLILRGLMLGALDSVWERENDNEVAPAKFAAVKPGEFVHAPLSTAIDLFEQRKVLPPAAFKALQDGAKRRAFTVAGLAKQELLDATHAELVRQLREGQAGAISGEPRGANLRDFQRFAKARIESAGWTPNNPSHVETIFRTNGMSAVASGRAVEMSQPAVLAALPYWQIRTVKDARQRPTHRAADGIVLPASHPFWLHAYPPFGFNCRCRVCARSKRWLEANGVTVGPPPTGLPDPGFESGTRTLISVPPSTLQPAPPAPVARPTPRRPLAPSQQLPLPLPEPVQLPTPSLAPPAPSFIIPPPNAPPELVTGDSYQAAGIKMIDSFDALAKKQKAVFGRTLSADELKSLVSPDVFDPGHKLTYISTASNGSELSLFARITDDRGEVVATIQREYSPLKGGGAKVHHAFLKVAPEHRDSGIGSRILTNQLAQYEALGVKKIELEAAWDGQYVWARAGFDPTPGQLRKLKDEFKSAYPHLPGDIVDKLPRARDLAMFEVDGVKVGKDFLRDRGNADGPLIPMSAKVDPADPKYQQIKAYFGRNAKPVAKDVVAEHFAEAARVVEQERKLQAARAAERQAIETRRAERPQRLHAALELQGAGVANGGEARLLLRDLVRETVPTVREGAVLGALEVDAGGPASRGFNAMFEPESGRVTFSPDIVARARGAMQRIGAGPIGKLTPEIRHELDGLRIMLHEEVHSLSGYALADVTPHSVVVEEIGTELTARRVMRGLVPELQLADAGTAYNSQISAVRYKLQKLKGIKADDALELMAQAHERASLRTKHATGEAGVQAWLEEMGLTAEQKGQILGELGKIQAKMFGGT